MYERELQVAESAGREAAEAIRQLYDLQQAETYVKSDGSFVTDADLLADEIIRGRLAEAFPGDAILTEETVDTGERLNNNRVWIVDPIDGTNQFIEKTGEFDVLIALAVDGTPVLGVSFQPSTMTLVSGIVGQGASIERDGVRTPLQLNPANGSPRLMTSTWMGAPENLPLLRGVATRLGTADVAQTNQGINIRRVLPTTGDADVIIGYAPERQHEIAWEWDFAAPEAIVTAAGGVVTNLHGVPHQYNKPVPRNENGIVLSVDPGTHERVVKALAPELG